MERQLRKLAETKLKEAELATRKAERERDLYRMVMLRVRSTYTGVVDVEDEEEENDLEAAEVNDSEVEDELIEEDEEEEEEGEEVEPRDDDEDGQNGHAESTQSARGRGDTELYLFDDDELDSDDEANELVFRDSVESDHADHEVTTSTLPVSIPMYDCSSNLGVESTASDMVSSSFNSSTTHDGSTLYASSNSRSSSPVHAFQSPMGEQLSAIKKDKRAVGKHKRADIAGDLANDCLRMNSMDSDDSSDYDNSSCVSFLSMESDSFSLERDPSKKLKSQNDLHNSSALSTYGGNNHDHSTNSNNGEGNGVGRGYFSALGHAFGLG